MKPFLLIVFYLTTLGLLLSGSLTYATYFRPTGCSQALITCGGDTPVTIFGVTQCVYGLIMFALIGVLAILAWKHQRGETFLQLLVWLGAIATLFAASLSYYELWIRLPKPATMPSCVYGFFLYIGVLLTALLARRADRSEHPVLLGE